MAGPGTQAQCPPGEGLGCPRCARLCCRPSEALEQRRSRARWGAWLPSAWGGGSWELPAWRVFSASQERFGSHADPGLGGVRPSPTARSGAAPRGQDLLPEHSSWPVCLILLKCTPPPPASGCVTGQTLPSLVPPEFSPRRPCQVPTAQPGLWQGQRAGWAWPRGAWGPGHHVHEPQRGGASRWLAPSPEHVITFVPHYEAVVLPGIYLS